MSTEPDQEEVPTSAPGSVEPASGEPLHREPLHGEPHNEPDSLVASSEPESQAGARADSAPAVRVGGDGPRRRIIVAQKPVEKPIAFISRDAQLAEEFEEQLGRARTVAVFPSLTHFCSDSSRMVWGGVVVARSCGWDERLLSFVPSTTCIAFWRLAEEGYGWPASVRRLDTQDDLRGWLEDIAKPLAFQLPKQKRSEGAQKRSSARQKVSKPQLKFELATVRSVVHEAPQQMELNGLSERRAEQQATAQANRAAGSGRSSVRPPLGRSSVGLAEGSERAKKATRHKAQTSALPSETTTPVRRRGRPAKTVASESLFAELPRVSSASVLRMPSNLPPSDERGFMKLAAELGLARASALLDELRTRAHSLR